MNEGDYEKAEKFAERINPEIEETGRVQDIGVRGDYIDFYYNSTSPNSNSLSDLYDYYYNGPDLGEIVVYAGNAPVFGPGSAVKGYQYVKTIGKKYHVFQKTVKSKNLGGQARAVYTKVKNELGKTVRNFKDAFKRDGRHYERANKYPINSRSRKLD